MSKKNVVRSLFSGLKKAFGSDTSPGTLIGSDHHGNKYYEGDPGERYLQNPS